MFLIYLALVIYVWIYDHLHLNLSKQDIQVTLREEIKSACEYRPFEKCDYVPRISNEICCKKIEYLLTQLDQMKETIEGYQSAA